jgi:glycerate 2-kinase
MKIVIAPNSFKNSLNAIQVAQAIDQGINESKLSASTSIFPIADGGDHTLEVAVEFFKGQYHEVNVEDPLQKTITARYGIINNGQTGVVEFTKASGLHLLKPSEYNPMLTSSFGTGQIIKKCVARGVKEIWLGVGGSATVEAGVGLLQACGISFLDKSGKPVERGAQGLQNIEIIETNNLASEIRDIPIKILSDVDNVLLGAEGAARIFGPQKGADEAMVDKLEQILSNYKDKVNRHTGKEIEKIKGGGAAGGIPASLSAFLNVEIVSGAGLLLDKMGFKESLEQAQVLITAEGKIDDQTLAGKGPAIAAKLAKQAGLAVIGIGGSIPEKFNNYLFDVLLAIGRQPETLNEALNNTSTNLTRTGYMIGNLLKISKDLT